VLFAVFLQDFAEVSCGDERALHIRLGEQGLRDFDLAVIVVIDALGEVLEHDI
jgi:hypothetical protein